MEDECAIWLKEALEVFPKLQRKKISIKYREMSSKKLGYVRASMPRKVLFDHEALLLGDKTSIRTRAQRPKEYHILLNKSLNRIKNIALKKQVALHIIMHELLHIEKDDLITLSKDHKLRKKKKIHINDFEDEIFMRYNQLRKIKGIMQIERREHLEIALQRTLESIRWNKR